jgi:hypothetical protein
MAATATAVVDVAAHEFMLLNFPAWNVVVDTSIIVIVASIIVIVASIIIAPIIIAPIIIVGQEGLHEIGGIH